MTSTKLIFGSMGRNFFRFVKYSNLYSYTINTPLFLVTQVELQCDQSLHDLLYAQMSEYTFIADKFVNTCKKSCKVSHTV